MKLKNETSLGAGFRQLGTVIEVLEAAGYSRDEHFSLKIGEGFCVFICQDAVNYLVKKVIPEFIFLEHNQSFLCKFKSLGTGGKQGVEVYFPRS